MKEEQKKNLSPAEDLNEEVYQYLLEVYENNMIHIGMTISIIMVILIGVLIVTAFVVLINDIRDLQLNSANSGWILPAGFLFLLLPTAVFIARIGIITPSSEMKLLKQKNFTYHIGTVTDKEITIESRYDSEDHYTHYYEHKFLYVDGEKYYKLLQQNDYALADPGDQYILIYIKGEFSFCTRIQDIEYPESRW